MKKIILLSCLLFSFKLLYAQPWMPHDNRRVKLADAVAAYKQQSSANIEAEDAKNNSEGPCERNDYLFQRWEWYMRQHCDADGYIVSPAKNLQEWLKYNERSNKTKIAAKTTGGQANWIFQGPHQTNGGTSAIGRINVVAFDPVDSNTFYVGSASGGTWKTTNGGASWTSLYDNWPTLGVADIKINPRNRNTIYVATGDGDAATAFSSGVIKSMDGGNSWQITGLNWLATDYLNAQSIIINPVDTNSITLAAKSGIYKSYNGGQNWTHVYNGSFRQMLASPVDTNVFYGTVYIGPSMQIVRSGNAGISWDTITNFTSAQRICLAVCPSSPQIVKAVLYDYVSIRQRIYSSSDTGHTYTCILDDINCASGCSGQAYYDLCIAMNPSDANKVTTGAFASYYSTNGGSVWQAVTQTSPSSSPLAVVHADKHFQTYHPLTGAFFETNDGGIFKTYDPLATSWTDLSNGIGITQFYRNAVDNGVDFCLGGAQDNGTKMLNAGIASYLTGADGMQCRINYGDPHHIWYCSYQLGYIFITRDSGATYTNIGAGSGYWITPFLIHPHDTATLFAGTFRVMKSYNNGTSWAPISPIFDSSYTLTDLAVAISNPNYIFTTEYSATEPGSVIHYTTNGGSTWDTLHNPTGININRMAIDPKNENIIWFAFSGYGPDKVYKYTLNTNAWVNYSSTLPDVPIDCIVIDSFSGARYIGTDVGVFYQAATDTGWTLFMNHLPSVAVYDLNINYTKNEIWAATFGRGMWKSIKADTPAVVLATSSLPISADAINIFPDPNRGVFTIYTTSKDLVGQKVSLILYAEDGKVAFRKEMQFDSSGKLLVNVPALKPGNYICEVNNRNMLTKSRLVVY